MFKLLARYLKNYLLAAIIIISLLFVQANLDLLLPNYMSGIVNTGIQQGGINEQHLKVVSQSSYQRFSLLFDQKENDFFLSSYQYLPQNSIEQIEKYPLLNKEGIYLLKEGVDPTQLTALWREPLALHGLQASNQLDLEKLQIPTDLNLFDYLSTLDASSKEEVKKALIAQLVTFDEATIKQTIVKVISVEYLYLGRDVAKMQNDYIISRGSQMLLITLVAAVCAILVSFFSARTASLIARNIRRDVFSKVENFSLVEFDKFSTASLITRTTNDITHIQGLITMSFRIIFYAPLLGIGALLNVLNSEASMVWIIGLGIVLVTSLAIGAFIFVVPKFKIVQKLIDKVNLVARENLTGLLVVRAFGSENYEEERFDQANRNLNKVQLFVSRAIVVLMPLMHFIMSGLGLLIVWFGAKQVDLGSMQVGNIMAFIQYAMQIIMSFVFIAAMFIMIPRASVSAIRIMEVLDTPLSIVDPPQPTLLPEEDQAEIEFLEVSFKYPDSDDYVLKDISFTAAAGKTTAIIGSTGSGKSTLVNLILRLFDVSGGNISFAGVDIRNITQTTLRSKIGYISQSAVLFSGTIEENLKYGKAVVSPEELEKALDIAQALDFVNEKPDGYQESIAQAGTNLSGGQKQRLAIARAIVKDADLYIFDDSFSALDFKTDAALRQALKSQLANKTLIIVTQRISTIRDADQIIVLDEGLIAGKGRHNDLMKTCQVYQEIAYSQLSQQELQNE